MDIITVFLGFIGLGMITALVLLGIRTINPRYRGLVERLGKYHAYKDPGMTFLIPLVDSLRYIDITEQMVEVDKQEIITKDALNATVDAQIYFKVKADEADVKASQYNVQNYEVQIVQLARTTLRSIIGDLTLADANTQRSTLNAELADQLSKETSNWGIEIVRAELKQLQPPEDVQESMNNVIKAKQNKDAAVDNATAAETAADGTRRALIKEAEGRKQAAILQAEGSAQAIQNVYEAVNKYFTGNAIVYKQLETATMVLKDNAKYIVPENADLVNVISEAVGAGPIIIKKDDNQSKEMKQ